MNAEKNYIHIGNFARKSVNHKNRIPEIVYIGNNNEPVRISTINKLRNLALKLIDMAAKAIQLMISSNY